MRKVEEAYMVMQDDCGIEVGDTVKVLRKAETREWGWVAAWAFSMDKFVCENGVVEDISREGVTVSFDREKCFLPFFVLEKIPKPHWRDTVSPENPVLCYVRDYNDRDWSGPLTVIKYDSSTGSSYPYRTGYTRYAYAKRAPKSKIESMLKAYDETSEDE